MKCCISSCGKDRKSSTVKFFRIPSRHHVDRLRLWREAIQRANGGTGEVNGSARVCGDHFLSGMSSEDPNSPDFVPSLFDSSEIIEQKKMRTERREGRHGANMREEEEIKTPPTAEDVVEDSSPVLMETEELQLSDRTLPQSTSVEEAEITTDQPEAETAAPQDTEPLGPTQTSLSIVKSKVMAEVRPVVFLKRVVVPPERFHCDQGSEDFTDEAQLNKHQQLHEENSQSSDDAPTDQPSFPCNICGRSYSSTHLLKRHKLLHVKDNRKCSTCGVMFCRRHNHMVFSPSVVAVVADTEEDSSASETEMKGRTVEKKKPVVSQKSRTGLIVAPATPATSQPESSPSTTRLRPLIPNKIKDPQEEIRPPVVLPLPSSPTRGYQHSHFQGSLKMFSPQYLTSALLNVKRNYQYIFSKSKTVEASATKVEPRSFESAERFQPRPRKELIAYDIEIEI